MKKTIFSFALAAAAASASAADFGVTAGLGAASVSADKYKIVDFGSVAGSEIEFSGVFAWNVGVKVNQDFNENVFGEASLLFQHQGFTSRPVAKSFVGSVKGDESKTYLYYLNLPVNAGYKFHLGAISPSLLRPDFCSASVL